MRLKQGDFGRRDIIRQKPECEEDNPPVPQQLINLLKMKAFREKLKTVKKKKKKTYWSPLYSQRIHSPTTTLVHYSIRLI